MPAVLLRSTATLRDSAMVPAHWLSMRSSSASVRVQGKIATSDSTPLSQYDVDECRPNHASSVVAAAGFTFHAAAADWLPFARAVKTLVAVSNRHDSTNHRPDCDARFADTALVVGVPAALATLQT